LSFQLPSRRHGRAVGPARSGIHQVARRLLASCHAWQHPTGECCDMDGQCSGATITSSLGTLELNQETGLCERGLKRGGRGVVELYGPPDQPGAVVQVRRNDEHRTLRGGTTLQQLVGCHAEHYASAAWTPDVLWSAAVSAHGFYSARRASKLAPLSISALPPARFICLAGTPGLPPCECSHPVLD
jgi:hypothetical protein